MRSTACPTTHACGVISCSAHRLSSARTGFQSHGLAFTNWCSDWDAVGESDICAASRRTVFLPGVVSRPST
ncbi:hypothetical protein GCM10020254_86620 [Streptomyces goshikiensis]